MATELRFTEGALKALPLPADGRAEFKDTKVGGLYLRVTSKGVKTFSFVGRPKGSSKVERVTIGKWPVVKVEEAQSRALVLAGELAKGDSAAATGRAKRAEMTVGELFVEYLEKSRARRPDLMQSVYKLYIEPKFGKRKLSEVTHSMVSTWHGGIPASIVKQRQQSGRAHTIKPTLGHRTANAAADQLRAMYRFAAKERIYTGENPAQSVEHFPEVERDRFVRKAELRPLFEALMAYPLPVMRCFFFACLMTGARRSNVASMKWEDIDFNERTWRIGLTKNGTPQTVALVPALMEMLQEMKPKKVVDGSKLTPEQAKKLPWVFPSPRQSKDGHIVEPKGAWRSILKTAGLSDLRVHDLRRTLGSWQAANGASLQVIGKSLNHKAVSSTAIYSRLDLDPVRQSVEQAATSILANAGAVESAKVLPFVKSA